jgi:hypothetical protein
MCPAVIGASEMPPARMLSAPVTSKLPTGREF